MRFDGDTPGLEDLVGDAWPADEDDLTRVGDDTLLPAFLSAGLAGEYHRIEGYRRAAEILYEQTKLMPAFAHQLIYPLGNCWRHHIELQLKALLRQTRHANSIPPAADRDRGHSTLALWKKLVPLLDQTVGGPDPDSGIVQRLVEQLDKLDRTGEDFRYAEANRARPVLAGLPVLDLDQFHGGLSGVSKFLDACMIAVAEAESMQQDLADEYGF